VVGQNQAHDGTDDALGVGVPLRLRKARYHGTLENHYLTCEFVEVRRQLFEEIFQRGGDTELREVLLMDFPPARGAQPKHAAGGPCLRPRLLAFRADDGRVDRNLKIRPHDKRNVVTAR
jgi:hypothetical protein